MSKWTDIKTELDTDPLGRGYAGMTDEQAAQDMDAGREDPTQAYRMQNQRVVLAELELAIRESLKWANYREKQQSREADGNTYIFPNMAEFMDIFFSTSAATAGDVDLQGAYFSGLINRMEAEGSMGPQAADLLRDFGEVPVSRGTEIGAGAISEGDVEYARGLGAQTAGASGVVPPGQTRGGRRGR